MSYPLKCWMKFLSATLTEKMQRPWVWKERSKMMPCFMQIIYHLYAQYNSPWLCLKGVWSKLTSSWIGVITTIRKEPIVLMADIEAISPGAGASWRLWPAEVSEVAQWGFLSTYGGVCDSYTSLWGNFTTELCKFCEGSVRRITAGGGRHLAQLLCRWLSCLVALYHNLDHDLLPTERVLGVQWCVQSDALNPRSTFDL